jgi:predicted phage-related endonuclease
MADVIAGLTAKQLEERDGPEGFVGGSEIAILAGHGYGTMINLWRRKTKKAAPLQENRRMTYGNVLEGPVASLWAREHGVSIFRAGTLRHPTHPFIGATPDRIVIPNHKARARKDWISTLQVKVRGGRRAYEYEDGQYPMSDYDQVQWEMLVAGLPRGNLVALVGGNEDEVREFEADESYQAGLISICEDFWKNYVLPDREPPPDGSEDYAAHLAARFPQNKGVLLDPSPATAELRERYLQASEQEKAAKEEKELVKQTLEAIIGEADGIEGIATWRKNKDGQELDKDGLLAVYEAQILKLNPALEVFLPVMRQQFTKAKPGSRVFRAVKTTK